MKYFSIEELTYSSTANYRGIQNKPSTEEEANLRNLVEDVLDKIRDRYGKPIRVNSGFRNAALNSAVGGSKTSQHMMGEAADITTGTRDGNAALFRIIKEMQRSEEIVFDQLIDEKNLSWIHVSYTTKRKNRAQVLKL